MDNVAVVIEQLKEELENLIRLKGISNSEVLALSQKLDIYILMHYSKK